MNEEQAKGARPIPEKEIPRLIEAAGEFAERCFWHDNRDVATVWTKLTKESKEDYVEILGVCKSGASVVAKALLNVLIDGGYLAVRPAPDMRFREFSQGLRKVIKRIDREEAAC